jgi:dolichol-phosphate mannosyltransferase
LTEALALSVVIPTFNEQDNIPELVRRLGIALDGQDAEIVFVDDSTDDTPHVIRQVARSAPLEVRMIHRPVDQREGGLGGAVVVGLRASSAPWCVVMDGDLQHPPELVPALVARGVDESADVVVASRYIDGGDAGGLSGKVRHLVSKGSTILTRAMFPRRLRDCTDPMTGFFALNTGSIDVDHLHPRGFKILLEILARQDLRVREESFIFGERFAGESKASFRQGMHFLHQLASLRFGRMSRFAAVGAFGTVLNLAIMAVLLATGVHYLPAAIVATELTILSNFLMQERLVFRDMRGERPYWQRLLGFFGFNNIETLVRIPVLILLVEMLHIPGVLAQAVTLAVAFLVRFAFTSRVLYRVRPSATPDVLLPSMTAAKGPAE